MPLYALYSQVLMVAAVWLTARHYYTSDASARSRRILLYIAGAAILSVWLLPSLHLLGVLAQTGICTYVLITAKSANPALIRPLDHHP